MAECINSATSSNIVSRAEEQLSQIHTYMYIVVVIVVSMCVASQFKVKLNAHRMYLSHEIRRPDDNMN